MDSKVVYITSERAQIVTLREADAEVQVVRKSGPRHPAETLGKNHPKKFDDTEHFMEKVSEFLEAQDARLLVVGPAQAKNRLVSHFKRLHPKLAAMTVGVETMDKATIPQIKAFARKFFSKLHRFEAL